jgi:hypothetical protein
MTEDTEKCVAVLTRCGPYSRAQAVALVPTLSGEEVAALKGLHERLLALDAAAEEGPPGSDTKPEPWKLQAELNEVGRKFRQLENVIADREAKAARAKANEQKALEQKVTKETKRESPLAKRPVPNHNEAGASG